MAMVYPSKTLVSKGSKNVYKNVYKNVFYSARLFRNAINYTD